MTEIITIVVFGIFAGAAYFQSRKKRNENQNTIANIWMILSIFSAIVTIISVAGLLI
jgi:L-cystine uptake protein TcyP (sodium:dicarboxylate symporter family)